MELLQIVIVLHQSGRYVVQHGGHVSRKRSYQKLRSHDYRAGDYQVQNRPGSQVPVSGESHYRGDVVKTTQIVVVANFFAAFWKKDEKSSNLSVTFGAEIGNLL